MCVSPCVHYEMNVYIKNLMSSYITRRDPHGLVVVALTLHRENPGSSSCGVTLQKSVGINQLGFI